MTPEQLQLMMQQGALGGMRQPMPQMAQPQMPKIGLGARLGMGVDKLYGVGERMTDAMFQVDPSVAKHLNPNQIGALQNKALMDMGAGILGAASRPGARFGESLAEGYFGAQKNMMGHQQMAYQLGANEREETRQQGRDKESDRRFGVQTAQEDRQLGQGDRRLGQVDTAFGAGREDEMWERGFKDRQLKEMSKYRLGMLGAQQGGGSDGGYSKEGLDLLAHSTLRSPTLMNAYMSRSGRYNASERKAVVERQAQILKENDITPDKIASIHANVKAQTGNIQAQTKSLQGLKAFDEVARANAERALQLFGKVSDSGVPLINAFTRGAQYGLGNEDVAELRQVLQNFQAETARIVAGHPQLLGATTDTARQEIERIVSGDMTKEQAERVIKRLLFEVDVRRSGFEEAIQESGTSINRLGQPGQSFDAPGIQRPGATGSWAPPQQQSQGNVVNWEDLK